MLVGYTASLMRALGLAVVVLCGCQIDDVAVSDVQSDVQTTQGCSLQGSTFNGTQLQGCSLQGCSLQGATFGGATLSGASVSGSALYVWRWRADLSQWEQRWPNKICMWDRFKLRNLGCTLVTSPYVPSPLAGTTFDASFLDPDGIVRTRTLEIGTSTTTLGAVKADIFTSAMFALAGSSAETNGCGLDKAGHRVNCDLWLYDVRFRDIADASGQPMHFCPTGQWAIALAGTWSANGTHANDSTKFTFACTNGTIAKCTRWGYRPWDSALMSDGTTYAALGPYHQSCVRAAAADYCAMGKSFTLDGTLVDIYDYTPSGSSPGFIPRTGGTAFALESTFDNQGATHIDHTRYPVVGGLADPTTVCPGRFVHDAGGGDVGTTWDRDPSLFPDPTWGQGPQVSIASAPSCAHSEWMTGRFIDAACNSACSSKIYGYQQYIGSGGSFVHPYESCLSPSGGWTSTCVSLATQLCTPAEHMTPHSECTQGATMPALGSQCTLQLSFDSALAHCFTGTNGTGWDAACVDAANARCSGGQESITTGFCGIARSILF